MKRQKKNKGIFGIIFSGLWLMIIIALLISFWKVNNMQDVGDLWKYLKIKSQEIQACLNKSVDTNSIQCSLRLKVGSYTPNSSENNPASSSNHNNSNDSTPPTKDELVNETESTSTEVAEVNSGDTSGLKAMKATSISKEDVKGMLDSLKVVPAYNQSTRYSRKDWKHWSPVSRNKCWNSREEALANQSVKGIVYLDKDGQETTDKTQACSIKSALWIDPLSGEKVEKPGQLDVDHIVPLALADRAGGSKWDKKTKEQYANDPDVLIVTTSKQNRSKGAKSPSEWFPPAKESHCDYAKVYINVLSKYKLTITQSDKSVLDKALSTCSQ